MACSWHHSCNKTITQTQSTNCEFLLIPNSLLCPGSSEVCRQCMECGARYGQRRKTRDVIAWAKKKRRLIKREELLAFLLDKPYPPDPSLSESQVRMEDYTSDLPPLSCSHLHQHTRQLDYTSDLPPLSCSHLHQHTRQLHLPSAPPSGLNCHQSPFCATTTTTTNPIPVSSPRRRALLRDDSSGGLLNESELYGSNMRENGRKRPGLTDCSSNGPIPLEFGGEAPVAKRMKLC